MLVGNDRWAILVLCKWIETSKTLLKCRIPVESTVQFTTLQADWLIIWSAIFLEFKCKKRVIITARAREEFFYDKLFSTSFIFLTASALLLNAACSSSLSSNSTIFSQPFLPITTGTPIQISFWPYSPSRNTQQVKSFLKGFIEAMHLDFHRDLFDSLFDLAFLIAGNEKQRKYYRQPKILFHRRFLALMEAACFFCLL